MTQLVDDAGTRSFAYNTYGERESDSLTVDGDTHLITETRDSFGRSTGFVYSKNGTVQHTVTTGYGTDGRISSAGFTHGGAVKQFGYEYLSGTNLLHKLTKPNNMTLTQTYEATRDLLTGMAYHRGSTLVAQREYTYDILGRPTARNTARNGQIVNDTFAHNTRSELAAATVNGADYEYAYDNIGNRQQATEGNDVTVYDANALNQYTSISENGAAPFVPQFDADGNQTLIKTETGIWSAVYNAENRPVSFTNSESNTVVECAYDSMGRRTYKKVSVNGSITLHQRYIYRGYLQIACIDLTRSNHPALWFITWASTQSPRGLGGGLDKPRSEFAPQGRGGNGVPVSQPVATRPLAIRKDGSWFTYGWDLTKNICEIFGPAGYPRTTYTYAPFGEVSASGDVVQPIQWSSEMWDSELGLVYYNWRYYINYGRFCMRDKVEKINYNKYELCSNIPINSYDYLGLTSFLYSYRNNFEIKFEEPHFPHFYKADYIMALKLYDDYVKGRTWTFSYDAHIIYDSDSNLRGMLHHAISETIDRIRNNQLELYRDIYVSSNVATDPYARITRYSLGRYFFKAKINVSYNQHKNREQFPYLVKILLHIDDRYDFDLKKDFSKSGIFRNLSCLTFGSVHIGYVCPGYNTYSGFYTVGERYYELYLKELDIYSSEIPKLK